MSKGSHLAQGGKQATFQGAAREMAGTDVFPELPKGPEGTVSLTREDVIPVAEDPFDAGPVPETKPEFGYEGDPVGDCVLIQRVEREHTSNLILPDSLKAKSDLGFVKAVGEAVKFYKPGNLVLFDKFASHGSDISLIDEDGIERHMLLLREYDLLMRLKKVAL